MTISPNEPSRPLAHDDPPTVGYLVGGLAQLALGMALIGYNASSEPRHVSIIGLFLVFLSVRTYIKYRARTKKA
jgi:hypothetical protein